MRRRITGGETPHRTGTGETGTHGRRPVFRDDAGQAALSLLKTVVVIAVMATAALDVALPVMTRIQLDNRAGQIASELDTAIDAAGGNLNRARDMIQLDVDNTDPAVVVEEIAVDPEGSTTVGEVTLSRRTDSLLLRDLLGLDSWYDVEVTRTAPIG